MRLTKLSNLGFEATEDAHKIWKVKENEKNICPHYTKLV